MTAPPDDTTADTSAIIATLRTERDAALAREAALAEALAQRNSEFGERIEQQSATIDVLKVMSASPGDPQPVFDLITRRAQELCNSKGAGVFEYDGALVNIRSTYRSEDEEGYANYVAAFPMKPTRGSIPSRAILDKRTVHIYDVSAEAELLPVVRNLGIKSVLAIPLLRDDNAVGAFVINSEEPGGFTESQVALLQTFAEQAVIAISSAETYRALQTRTSDLQESLEYQTATSDVLKVISRSTFDLQPVLDTLIETAARLCEADLGHLALPHGDTYRSVASFALSPELESFVRGLTFARDTGSLVGRAVVLRRVVHVEDIHDDPEHVLAAMPDAQSFRTMLGVPLFRAGEPIGVIALIRQRVEPFTDRQIELVSTFADQAVIAIENTRLLTEQREALEQQTATAEVLQVINANPGNLAPVFDAMLEKAMRLLGASFGLLYTLSDNGLFLAAQRGVPAVFAEYRAKHPMTPRAGDSIGRVYETRRPVHVLDLKVEYGGQSSGRLPAIVTLGGARTLLMVPLLKDAASIGHIGLYRQEVQAFSDKQIALLENFAAQAVIAIENARLLNEIAHSHRRTRTTPSRVACHVREHGRWRRHV
jgi:GAF domain-containing protein